MFNQPFSANSPIIAAISLGPRSYCPISLGKPALGWQLIGADAIFDNSSRCGRII